MGRCGGLDLTCKDSVFVETTMETTKDGSPCLSGEFSTKPFKKERTSNLLDKLAQKLEEELANGLPPRVFHKDTLKHEGKIEHSQHGELKELDKWDRSEIVGICYPYSTPPYVRHVLPLLASRHWGESGPLEKGPNIAMIEAPLAACLDWIHPSMPPLPSMLVVLCGPKDAAELTAIKLTGDQRNLTLRVLDSLRIGGSRDSSFLKVRMRSLHSLLSELEGPTSFIVVGRDLNSVKTHANTWLKFPENDIKGIDESTTLAKGAARYAAFRCAQASLASGYDNLTVQHVVPHSVGVLSTYRNGQPCWRRLFASGESLPSVNKEFAPEIKLDELPSELMFAEIVHPEFEDFLWLEGEKWKSRRDGMALLKLHSSARLDHSKVNADSDTVSLSFELRNGSGTEPVTLQEVKVSCKPHVSGH